MSKSEAEKNLEQVLKPKSLFIAKALYNLRLA